MTTRTLLHAICAVALSGCAHTQLDPESGYAARMKHSGDRYLGCMTAEAEKDMKNPAGAEDIAIAAHARCWTAWDDYRKVTNASFLKGARTPGEQQFARDKAEAHLRQFEREAQRTVVDAVVQRNLRGVNRAP
jgi:hypothetical protein